MKNRCGMIFDTDIILSLDKYGLLNELFDFVNSNHIDIYYPTAYEYEIDPIYSPELKQLIDEYRRSKKLSDVSIDSDIEKYKNILATYPFDNGEAYCYSIAEKKRLVILSNDILAAYSYLVLKYKNELKSKSIYTEELFEKFYANETVREDVAPRFNLYSILKMILKKSDTDIDKLSKGIRPRTDRWFSPKQIAEECWWIKFPNIKSFYLSIGVVAASMYSLSKDTSDQNFKTNKHWEKNIGLKIKSTHRKISNFTLVENEKYRYNGKTITRRKYNFVARKAILKYLSTNIFLVNYLVNRNGKFLGELAEIEFNRCRIFCNQFRCLYDSFRRYDY